MAVSLENPSSLPPFFLKRSLDSEYEGKRLLENEEVGLLSILNSAGKITTQDSFLHLMRLMLKVEKLEHRALCLEILLHHLDRPDCLSDFVLFGGFRLIKKWLKRAEEDKSSTEIRYLVQFTRRLPFDSVAIKRTEIGKAIKRLQKLPDTSTEGNLLQTEVALLMEEWKEKAVQEKKEQQERQARDAPPAPAPASAPSMLASQSREEERMGVETVPAPAPAPAPSPSSASAPSLLPYVPRPRAPAKGLELLPFLLQNKGENSSLPVPVRERKPINMLEKARILIASNASASLKEGGEGEGEGETLLHPAPNKDLKPLLKGGLKKSGEKRSKGVRWADEEGGLLREVQHIEVDKIKSSVASYKSHKDLVKKERQLEKEVYLSKASDTMRPSLPYSPPAPLSLSIAILDNMGVPSSQDKEKQARRLAHVLEMRYLDESLIPDDPAVDPLCLPQGAEGVQAVPWLMAGEEEEREERVVASLPQGEVMRDESALLASLPIQIQMLDPLTLQGVLGDEQALHSLFRSDGSVDESRLHLLQSCASVEEYKQTLDNFVSFMPSYGAGGVGGMGGMGNMAPMGGMGGMGAAMGRMEGMGGMGGGYGGYDHNNNNNLVFNNNMGGSNMMWGAESYPSPSPWNMMSNMNETPRPAPVQKRGASSKSLLPCRFFNTPKGCINGNRCAFGHFLPDGTVGNMNMGGMGGRAMGPGMRSNINSGSSASGPGGRFVKRR